MEEKNQPKGRIVLDIATEELSCPLTPEELLDAGNELSKTVKW